MSPQITTELVKELRDKTGISVMQCRKALEEAEGDIDKALLILKKNSASIAEKKADREAKDGRIDIKISSDRAVLVTLHCETDFVSKNNDFINLLSALSDLALSGGVDKMKSNAKEMIDPVIQKTGEKIELGASFEAKGNTLGSYVHNGKIGVLVSLDGGNADLARDVAMHIAAMKPEYLSSADITEDTRKVISEVFEKEIAGVNKTEDVKKKMLAGKINTYFKEKTLTEQPFIKNPEETISALLSKNNAKIREVKQNSI